MAGRGRPTKYDPAMVDQGYKLCALFGADTKKLAAMLGTVESTIRLWCDKYPDFSVALKKGKDEYDSQVIEANLIKRANGYSYTESILEPVVDPATGQSRMQIIKKTIRSVPPDVTAQIFWLKNRNPPRWRDVNRTELTGADGNPVEIISRLSDDQVKQQIAEYEAEVLSRAGSK